MPFEKFGTVRIDLTKIVGIYTFFFKNPIFQNTERSPLQIFGQCETNFSGKIVILGDAITHRTQKKVHLFGTQNFRSEILSENHETPFLVV